MREALEGLAALLLVAVIFAVFVALALVLSDVLPADAQGFGARGFPGGTETVTVGAAAVGLSTTLCRVGQTAGRRETQALLQIKTAPIFYTLHSPTATPASADYEGAVGDIIILEHPSRFRAIRATAVDGAVKVTCFE